MGENKILEKKLARGRWYVKLENKVNNRNTVPNAWYVWLNGNPSFKEIPKGYAIHHLDHNELNDDISNLVLMNRHHHTAHHLKQKTIQPKLNLSYAAIKNRDIIPSRKPTIWHINKNDQYSVCIHEKIDGGREMKRITKRGNFKIKTKKDAEKIAADLWDEFKEKGFIRL